MLFEVQQTERERETEGQLLFEVGHRAEEVKGQLLVVSDDGQSG